MDDVAKAVCDLTSQITDLGFISEQGKTECVSH